jgi:hypothetical protein
VLTVVAVLALWSLASVALGATLGGVITLRGRDRALEAGRVHSLDSLDLPVTAPPLAASVS